jgi:hypothetical protein
MPWEKLSANLMSDRPMNSDAVLNQPAAKKP